MKNTHERSIENTALAVGKIEMMHTVTKRFFNEILYYGMGSILFILLLVSCNKETASVAENFVIDPPIAKLSPSFTEINITPNVDSVYILENGTSLTIKKNSLLDEAGNPIKEKLKLKFRQFDDGVSVFLAGMPLGYKHVDNNLSLQTAGMFEIRGQYKGQEIRINPDAPVSITMGTNYTDKRQGFFKLNEKNGNWDLVEIPEITATEGKAKLEAKLAALKKELRVPLAPHHYVFDYRKMADIFIGEENYAAIYKTNMHAMESKMKKYGADLLPLNIYRASIPYKGNNYMCNELLWKSQKPIKLPAWTKDKHFTDRADYYNAEVVPVNSTTFEFRLHDPNGNQHFTFRLELISHLRYLLKYSPEQLAKRSAQIDKEIIDTERKIKQSKLLELTVSFYSMGIFNFDRPVYYRPEHPALQLTLEGKTVDPADIKKMAIFNANLSSVSYPNKMNPLDCPFFKGRNKIFLMTKDGRMGLLTAEKFAKLVPDSLHITQTELKLDLQKVELSSEKELRKLLEK